MMKLNSKPEVSIPWNQVQSWFRANLSEISEPFQISTFPFPLIPFDAAPKCLYGNSTILGTSTSCVDLFEVSSLVNDV